MYVIDFDEIQLTLSQKKALKNIVDVLIKRNDFLGLFGFGSIFEDIRTPTSTSDIDLIGIVKSSIYENHVFVLNGVSIELFFISFDTVIKNIISIGNHFETRNIGAGKLICYKDPIVKKIKQLAEERYYKFGIYPLDKVDIFLKRATYGDVLKRIKMMSSNSILKYYQLDFTMECAINDWFLFSNRYNEKHTYHFKDFLRFGDKFMYDKCHTYYSTFKIMEKEKIVKEVVSYVVGLVGGFPAKEWEVIYKTSKIKLINNFANNIFDRKDKISNNNNNLINKVNIEKYKKKRYYKHIKYIVNKYINKKDVMGIFFVNPKQQQYNLFLEFYVLLSSRYSKSIRKVFYNELIRIEEKGLTDFTYELFVYNKEGFIRKFSNISIIYSNDIRTNLIVEFSKKILIYKNSSCPFNEQISRRKRTYHLVRDSKKFLKRDPAVALYLMNIAFNYVLENYYILSNIPKPELVDILNDIKKKDIFLFNLCKKFLRNNIYESKLEELERLVNYILIPYGGNVPLNYSLPPESLFLKNFNIKNDLLKNYVEDRRIGIT